MSDSNSDSMASAFMSGVGGGARQALMPNAAGTAGYNNVRANVHANMVAALDAPQPSDFGARVERARQDSAAMAEMTSMDIPTDRFHVYEEVPLGEVQPGDKYVTFQDSPDVAHVRRTIMLDDVDGDGVGHDTARKSDRRFAMEREAGYLDDSIEYEGKVMGNEGMSF